jgi:uncharacterized damage-inducible protein DinB
METTPDGPHVLGELGEPGPDISDLRGLLLGYLDWYRATVLRKIYGLSDDVLRTPAATVGWAPLGLVKHLGWVERRWMRWGFAAERIPAFPPGGQAMEWRIADDEPTERITAIYRAEIRWSRELCEGVPLHRRSNVGGRFATAEEAPSLGRILFHLLQEYARHAGQLDVVREMIDGQTGE